MCGRFILTTPPEVLRALYRLGAAPAWSPRFNIAPTQEVLVIRAGRAAADLRRADRMRWGLIPSWATDPGIGTMLLNARGEEAHDKPAFRAALKARRAAIPADGFYEWQRLPDGSKQPHLIARVDGQPMTFAALWESWRPKEQPDAPLTLSCTVLTCAPNAFMAKLHNRMPVLLHPDDLDRWLDPDLTDPEGVADLIRAAGEGVLDAHAVSTRVNSVRHDEPGLVLPVAQQGDLF